MHQSCHYHCSVETLNGSEIHRMLRHYRFDGEEAKILKRLGQEVEKVLPDLIPGFYEFIFAFDHARIFLHSDEIIARHEKALSKWFMALFTGEYEEEYFEMLERISETHVRIGLPPHYLHAAFSYLRRFMNRWLLEQGYGIVELEAIDKILDINLDILGQTYRDGAYQKLLGDIVLIKKAVGSGRVEPYVQPIFQEEGSPPVSYECLMRLINTETGEVYSIFPLLDTARSIHLYEGLMELMVDKSIRIFEHLPHRFSLNLSYEDIGNSRFRRYFLHKVGEFSDPRRLTVEVLETDFIEDFEAVTSFVDELRTLGCAVAIDDFGAGYSSMENIMRLRPDFIKIDGSLVLELEHSESSKGIIQSIVEMAKSLGAKTVAEYVASEDLYRKVKELGVDYVQGYYLGKPFDARKLLEERGIRES